VRGTRGAGEATSCAAWLTQPGYLVAEVLLALFAGVGYSLADDTISALGTSCDSAATTGCSSAPLAMNVVFIAFGALQAVGAIPLLHRATGTVRREDRRVRLVGWLWVVAGVSSVGVGLAPLDAYPIVHSLVALPVFVGQPLALLLHARWLTTGRLRVVGTVLGIAALVGAVAFGALLGADSWSGAAERLAVWPPKAWFALAALALHAASRPPSRSAPDPAPGPGPVPTRWG
jgi:hypothetical protein